MQAPGRPFARALVVAMVGGALLLPTSSAFAAGPKVIGSASFVGRAGLEGIPIVSFAWTARSTVTPGGSGSGSGRTLFDPFHVVMVLDTSSPALLDLLFRGSKLQEVHVDVNVRRGTTASYVLTGSFVVGSERRVPDGGGVPLVDLSLAPTTVRETVVSPGGTVTTCFDIDAVTLCE